MAVHEKKKISPIPENGFENEVIIVYPSFVYRFPDGGYTGLDFGPGIAPSIAKIRFLPTLSSPYLMLGGRFQGSRGSYAGGFEDIHVIGKEPRVGWNTVIIKNPRPYRYVRYLGPPGSYCNVSKIEYYSVMPGGEDNTASREVKLTGVPFGTSPSEKPGNEYDVVYRDSPDVLLSFKEAAKKNDFSYHISSSGLPSSFYHQHDFLELCYIKNGSCFHVYDGKYLYLFAGDWFVIPPGEYHYYMGGKNLCMVKICLYPEAFPPHILHELSQIDGCSRLFQREYRFKTGDGLTNRFHLHIEQQKEVAALLAPLEKEFRTRPLYYRISCQSLLTRLFVLLDRYFRGGGGTTPEEVEYNQRYEKIKKTISYIEENYTSIINVEVIANLLSISYSRLAHLFKEETGLNIYDYLNGVRVGDACQKLIENKERVIDIAFIVGFQNYSNFARMFKLHIGCSPKQFRDDNILTVESPIPSRPG